MVYARETAGRGNRGREFSNSLTPITYSFSLEGGERSSNWCGKRKEWVSLVTDCKASAHFLCVNIRAPIRACYTT
jgi:hypothetical protein